MTQDAHATRGLGRHGLRRHLVRHLLPDGRHVGDRLFAQRATEVLLAELLVARPVDDVPAPHLARGVARAEDVEEADLRRGDARARMRLARAASRARRRRARVKPTGQLVLYFCARQRCVSRTVRGRQIAQLLQCQYCSCLPTRQMPQPSPGEGERAPCRRAMRMRNARAACVSFAPTYSETCPGCPPASTACTHRRSTRRR